MTAGLPAFRPGGHLDRLSSLPPLLTELTPLSCQEIQKAPCPTPTTTPTLPLYPLKGIWGGGGYVNSSAINHFFNRTCVGHPQRCYHGRMSPPTPDLDSAPDPTSDTAPQAKPRRHRSAKGPRYHPDDPVPDHPNLTVQGLICLYIRKGAFSHIAAMAAGIPEGVFHDWLKAAEGKHSRRFRKFRDAVLQAEAQARVKAELAVFEENPRAWLREGPGRHQGSRLGWSVPAPAPAVSNQMQVNIQHSPEWSALWAEILARAAPFPEARAALSDALKDLTKEVARPIVLPAVPVPIEASE